MSIVFSALVILVMLACLLIIPLGLPGLWLIAAALLALLVTGQLSWMFALVGTGAVVGTEVAELWVLKRFGERFGGSSRAFWGAMAGGMAGLFFGLPIPVVGSVITAFLGTFAGAGLVTFLETRSMQRSTRVGMGVVLARTTAVALKVGVALAIIAATALALFVGAFGDPP